MKIAVHDYSGHPFQIHLSRHLARRGHDVIHLYCADNPGPKGLFERPDQALRVIGVTTGDHVTHAAGTGAQIGVGRFVRDLTYGRQAARIIRSLQPDIVLCGNTPADSQRAIIKVCKRDNIRFVYWLQDVFGEAVSTLLTKKFGHFGKVIGKYYQHLDRHQFRASDAIVAISDDFLPHVAINPKVSVIENWGAIDDISVGAKDNTWSRQHDLNRFAYIYTGTLGRKHNPNLLLKLAQQCDSNDTVVVVGQGFGIPLLQAAKKSQPSLSLKLLPIQPAEFLTDMLATADVLLATIEADAGTFAVPSKVLSYLCAGRPILLAAPKSNLAARTVERANAGIVVRPDDDAAFLAAAMQLRRDSQLRAELGANGRAYAEKTFDLEHIADKFEAVILHTGLNRSPQYTTVANHLSAAD